MKTRTFATLRRAQNDDIGSFSSNYCEIDHFPRIVGESLVFSCFQVEFTTFRPRAVTLTWCREIIEYFLPNLRNYHVFGEIPQLLVNSTILVKFGEFHVFRVFAFFGGPSHLLLQKSYVVIKGRGGVILSTFSSSDSSSSSNKIAPHTDVHLYGAERGLYIYGHRISDLLCRAERHRPAPFWRGDAASDDSVQGWLSSLVFGIS